jgi:imidazolonepropionase-like amidohydrolase
LSQKSKSDGGNDETTAPAGLVARHGAAARGAEKPTAIRAGRLLDVRSGELRSSVTILIRDGKIAAVGENLRLPSDAQVIDLSRRPFCPA